MQFVQLAIQGGGAKLIPLLAACEAIQALEAEDNPPIKITRVAGTSAGAIAGCIFAAHIPMSTARLHFQKSFESKVLEFFPSPSYWNYYQLTRGQQLWSTDPLRESLQELFKLANVVTFADLKIPVIVVASDLVNGAKKEFSSGDLVDALLHSSALPYCFRVWNSGGNNNPVFVDGGICENLPSEILEPFEAQAQGTVVALSFKPEPAQRPPSDIKQFSLALLDTAISNSMSRAKLRLGKERVHEIKTSLKTFDFESALRLDPQIYASIKDNAAKFFRDFAKRREDGSSQKDHKIDSSLWEQQNITMMENLGRIFKGQHADSLVNYEQCALIVQVNGFDDAPDEVRYRAVYKTDAKPFYCQGFSMAGGSEFLKNSFSLVDQNGEPVKLQTLPYRDPDASDWNQLMAFFLPPLSPFTGPYTLEVRHRVKDFMGPLVRTREDELAFTPRRGKGPVGRVDLVLHIPESFKNARMVTKEGHGGRELKPGELTINYPPPIGFRAIGWRGENRPPDVEFGASVILGSEAD
jgi:NTE family protein